MLAIVLAAFAVPPQAPPLEDRVRILEAKVAALESKCNACQCSAPAKTPVAVQTFDLQPSVKSADAPTEFFPPGTTMVCGPNGCYPSAAPVSVSYPGGPFRQPIQRGGFRLFRGRSSCGPGGCN